MVFLFIFVTNLTTEILGEKDGWFSFWYTKIDFAFKMVFLFISVTNLDIEIVREKNGWSVQWVFLDLLEMKRF